MNNFKTYLKAVMESKADYRGMAIAGLKGLDDANYSIHFDNWQELEEKYKDKAGKPIDPEYLAYLKEKFPWREKPRLSKSEQTVAREKKKSERGAMLAANKAKNDSAKKEPEL